jgi:hypothetical protein
MVDEVNGYLTVDSFPHYESNRYGMSIIMINLFLNINQLL